MTYRPGVAVHRQVVPTEMTDACLRMIHLNVRYNGMSAHDLLTWGQHPFPFLRAEQPVQAIASYLDGMFRRPGTLVEPHQIVWHLPDDAPDDYPLSPHIDVPPVGTRYTSVAGVAFNRWHERNGTLRVWVPEPEAIDLQQGDVVVLDPWVLHSPGINRSGEIRMGLYIRWVEPASE